MAAITSTFFGLLERGDHVIFDSHLYGGTYHAIIHELTRFGIEYSFVQVKDGIAKHVTSKTKLVYFESPSNPLLEIIDLKRVVEEAKESNLLVAIDNTFASPINQNPINFGVDIVLHSVTKYLGGHSDIICGAVITTEKLLEPIRKTAINFGGNVNAATAALLERSLKTLAIRVEKQNENATQLAGWLSENEKVTRVYYPGLPSHDGHLVAAQQMHGFGGMLSFEVDASLDEIEGMLTLLQVIQPAISLGGVESTISLPVKTSHAKMTSEERQAIGIDDSLLRFSVGIEGAQDLIDDLDQAIRHV
jgi:cystathionine beta-lyase